MRLELLLLALPFVLNCSSLWRDARVHSIKEATYLLKITADPGDTAAIDAYLASRTDHRCVQTSVRNRPREGKVRVRHDYDPFKVMEGLRKQLTALAEPTKYDPVRSGGCYAQMAKMWREAQAAVKADSEKVRWALEKGWRRSSADDLREVWKKWQPFAKAGCEADIGGTSRNATSLSGSEALKIGESEGEREFERRKAKAERYYLLLMDAVHDRMAAPKRVRTRRRGWGHRWKWVAMEKMYEEPLAHLLDKGEPFASELTLSLGCYVRIAKMLERRVDIIVRAKNEEERLKTLGKRFQGVKKDCRNAMLTETPRCTTMSGLQTSDRALCQKACARVGMAARVYVVRKAAEKCASAYRTSGDAPLSCTFPDRVGTKLEPILQSSCKKSCAQARAHYDKKSEERWEAADKKACRSPRDSWACRGVERYLQRGGKLAHETEAKAMVQRAAPALKRLQKKEEKDAGRASSRAAAADAAAKKRRCRVWRARLATHGSCSSFCAYSNRGNRGGFDLGYGLCVQSCSRCRR